MAEDLPRPLLEGLEGLEGGPDDISDLGSSSEGEETLDTETVVAGEEGDTIAAWFDSGSVCANEVASPESVLGVPKAEFREGRTAGGAALLGESGLLWNEGTWGRRLFAMDPGGE